MKDQNVIILDKYLKANEIDIENLSKEEKDKLYKGMV